MTGPIDEDHELDGYPAPCGQRFETREEVHRHMRRCHVCEQDRPDDDDKRWERQREYRLRGRSDERANR